MLVLGGGIKASSAVASQPDFNTAQPLSTSLSVSSAFNSFGLIAQLGTSELDDENPEDLREYYIQGLSIVDEALERWQKRRSIIPTFDHSQDLILANRRKALDAYDGVDYREALRLLSEAIAEIESVEQQEAAYFEVNLRLAAEAYDELDEVQATSAIERALRIRPDNLDALDWKQRIDAMPVIIAQLKVAVDARNAGRLQDELEALTKLKPYRPFDTSIDDRIHHLQIEISQRRFETAIGQGNQAVIDNDLKTARRALARAKQLKPSHAQTQLLTKRITDTARLNKIESLLKIADQHVDEDDWEAALKYYQQVLVIDAESNEAINGQVLGGKVLSAQRKLDDFLARSSRLSTPAISKAARATIEESKGLSVVSASIGAAIKDLEKQLSIHQSTVPLRVLSDGETHVEVRGVGIVGRTSEKIIHLRPGIYELEGKRPGFRSKLVRVKLAPESDAIAEVVVICDEPIS